MMKLSVIFTGRDDNYGENFIERLDQCLTYNLNLFEEHDLDYELVVVDFNPLEERYLHENPMLKEKLSKIKVKNIIIDNSILISENLSPTTYYEYFAKNSGIRNSTGNFLFLTNSDIIFSEDLVIEIKDVINKEDAEDYFYRVRFRAEIPLGTFPSKEIELVDLHMPHLPDACICGMYSGDASMFSRKSIIEVATGYNEGEMRHRTSLSQSSMDGEILWNLYNKGKKLKFLESSYYHIEHGHPNQRDNHYEQGTYENLDGWGFVNYKSKKLNTNTIFIYS
ncbi:hypothetical protein EBQ91_02970 [bacterium]|nr:hypothetical protein [bacterium]